MGETELLGRFTTVEHVSAHADLAGNAIAEDVVGALTTSGGDALYYRDWGLSQKADYVFTITGGKGRFQGASGSGVMKPEFGATPEEFICHFDGSLTYTKALQ